MPLCPNCGSRQPDGAAFCDDCGAKLEEAAPVATPPVATPPQPTPTVAAMATTCSVCGASVIPGEAFCDNCGAALGPAAPAPASYATVPAPPPSAAAPPPVSVLVCPNCSAQLEPGSNFCDMCGASVSAVPPPSFASAPPPPSAPAPIPSPAPVATPLPTPPRPVYPSGAAIRGRLVAQSTNVTIPFPPGKTEVVIGREDPVSNVFPEIDLTDHGGDEGGVSRRHARIFVQGDQVLVEDLNSTNYTYVNQQRLTPEQPHPLNDGDEIRFGRVKLNFYV
ncbi:MAG: zinc ribbon domain-containing protein [Chloroflexota bacterium]|nr:zinc ribbon domain-containing protein [Chloroflexota bacterium]